MASRKSNHSTSSEPQQPPTTLLGRVNNVFAIALIYLGESVISFFRRLKPASPAIIPVFTCLLSIPFLMLFSLAAGWSVWRSVPKGWEVPVYLQYGDGVPPYAHVALPPMSTSAPYDISLLATVPATKSNYALGNFMTSLTLTTTNNATVSHIRRPTLVLPLNPGVMSYIFRSPSMQDFKLSLLSGFIPSSSHLIAQIEIGRKDAWRGLGNGEGRELSVYSAVLRGDVRPQGLRRILATFPISVATVSAITFFSVSLFIVTICTIPSIKYNLDTSQEARLADSSPKNSLGAMAARRRSTDTFFKRLSATQRVDQSPIEEDPEEDVTGGVTASPHIYPTPEPETPRRRRVSRYASSSDDDA